MKKVLFIAALLSSFIVSFGQKVKKSEKKSGATTTTIDITDANVRVASLKSDNEDSLIKEKLVALALANPDIDIANANIKIAEAGTRKAKGAWLSSIAVGGNVNEFVVNNSPAANFFPKYNVGVSVPFDIFSRTRYEKKVAAQNVVITKDERQMKVREIKLAVLTRYENYKEKKELMRLQKIVLEPDYQGYIAAQKSYADGTMELEEMNKVYQSYINEQAKVVSKERDFNIAVYELEELIGVPLNEALNTATVGK